MTDREVLIREINELPDFLIKQLRGIIHYLKLGIEHEEKVEFECTTNNNFYDSMAFNNILTEAISAHKKAETEDMDVLENAVEKN